MSSYLGQNFLVDSKAKLYIRDLSYKFKTKYNLTNCIEIGPGKWAITKLIQPIFNKEFWAIEKDSTFKPLLKELIGNNLIFDDVLQVDFSKEFTFNLTSTLLYGSLPYYITSPIIRKLFLPNDTTSSPNEWKKIQWLANNTINIAPSLSGGESWWGSISYGIFIVQKEFAEKIETNAKKKSYLRWLLNHNHIVTYHKKIPAKWFLPAPKVDSAIISIIPWIKQEINYRKLLLILDKISWFKRKTIGKIIKILEKSMSNRVLLPSEREAIDYKYNTIKTITKKRIEELSWEEMRSLVEYLDCKIY